MVHTRAQLEEMSKEQLINELVDNSNVIQHSLESLNSKMDRITSDLAISRRITDLLRERVNQLERDQLSSSQYIRREMLEVGPILESIPETEVENVVAKAVSLCGPDISPSDLDSCHRLK